ncbi:hypothetical protein J5N97_022344 [Dioscorea zingiberensis]|uniref:Cytochrome P450 n=1 Tax=Dioscorea zingiberensis TaxID=325984 RepID=A0A9D5HAR1_9LILI|nr:hypothetical protein J5N97_022344 [Dioscorea zingiberensis]
MAFELLLNSPTLLLLLPLVLLLLSIRLVSSNKRSSVRLPPSPWKLPLIGNLHQMGSLPHRSLDKLAKKHGPIMLLKLGQVPTLVVTSSKLAREILKTHDLIFASRPHLKAAHIILYGKMDMAFAPYGEHWRQMRKIAVTNLLSMRRVQSFQAVREMEVAHLMDKISQSSSSSSSSSKKALNMSHLLFCFTNNMLCRAILGDFSKQEGMNEIFQEMIEETMALLCCFNMEDYFPSLGWLSSLSGLDERAKRNFIKWDGILSQMIKERTDENDRNDQKDDDFVDILLSLKKDPNLGTNLTNEHIKALLVDMFAAGTDTSYIVLEWGMAELIRNPNIMKKLQDEVKRIASGKSMVNEHDLGEMHYLKAVIKEILRLHPPGPLLLPRESMDSCQLEGYEIPNKTRVIINFWAIARDPKVWEKPNEFIPERFLNNPIDFKGQNYEYIPFGSGRRICPGMHFGVSTVELTLANLVYRFDWLLPDALVGEVNMTETLGVTMKMKNNLHLVPKPCF